MAAAFGHTRPMTPSIAVFGDHPGVALPFSPTEKPVGFPPHALKRALTRTERRSLSSQTFRGSEAGARVPRVGLCSLLVIKPAHYQHRTAQSRKTTYARGKEGRSSAQFAEAAEIGASFFESHAPALPARACERR